MFSKSKSYSYGPSQKSLANYTLDRLIEHLLHPKYANTFVMEGNDLILEQYDVTARDTTTERHDIRELLKAADLTHAASLPNLQAYLNLFDPHAIEQFRKNVTSGKYYLKNLPLDQLGVSLQLAHLYAVYYYTNSFNLNPFLRGDYRKLPKTANELQNIAKQFLVTAVVFADFLKKFPADYNPEDLKIEMVDTDALYRIELYEKGQNPLLFETLKELPTPIGTPFTYRENAFTSTAVGNLPVKISGKSAIPPISSKHSTEDIIVFQLPEEHRKLIDTISAITAEREVALPPTAKEHRVLGKAGPVTLVSSKSIATLNTEATDYYMVRQALRYANKERLSQPFQQTGPEAFITLRDATAQHITVHRPNHGLAHTARQMRNSEDAISLFAMHARQNDIREFCQEIADNKDIYNLIVAASAFLSVGRENEKDHEQDPGGYVRARKLAADTFKKFIDTHYSFLTTDHFSFLFTLNDAEREKFLLMHSLVSICYDAIENLGNPVYMNKIGKQYQKPGNATQKKIAGQTLAIFHILNTGHIIDVMRFNTRDWGKGILDSRLFDVEGGILNPYTHQIHEKLNTLWDKGIERIKVTGNRLTADANQKGQYYTSAFIQASLSPEYVENILGLCQANNLFLPEEVTDPQLLEKDRNATACKYLVYLLSNSSNPKQQLANLSDPSDLEMAKLLLWAGEHLKMQPPEQSAVTENMIYQQYLSKEFQALIPKIKARVDDIDLQFLPTSLNPIIKEIIAAGIPITKKLRTTLDKNKKYTNELSHLLNKFNEGNALTEENCLIMIENAEMVAAMKLGSVLVHGVYSYDKLFVKILKDVKNPEYYLEVLCPYLKKQSISLDILFEAFTKPELKQYCIMAIRNGAKITPAILPEQLFYSKKDLFNECIREIHDATTKENYFQIIALSIEAYVSHHTSLKNKAILKSLLSVTSTDTTLEMNIIDFEHYVSDEFLQQYSLENHPYLLQLLVEMVSAELVESLIKSGKLKDQMITLEVFLRILTLMPHAVAFCIQLLKNNTMINGIASLLNKSIVNDVLAKFLPYFHINDKIKLVVAAIETNSDKVTLLKSVLPEVINELDLASKQRLFIQSFYHHYLSYGQCWKSFLSVNGLTPDQVGACFTAGVMSANKANQRTFSIESVHALQSYGVNLTLAYKELGEEIFTDILNFEKIVDFQQFYDVLESVNTVQPQTLFELILARQPELLKDMMTKQIVLKEQKISAASIKSNVTDSNFCAYILFLLQQGAKIDNISEFVSGVESDRSILKDMLPFIDAKVKWQLLESALNNEIFEVVDMILLDGVMEKLLLDNTPEAQDFKFRLAKEALTSKTQHFEKICKPLIDQQQVDIAEIQKYILANGHLLNANTALQLIKQYQMPLDFGKKFANATEGLTTLEYIISNDESKADDCLELFSLVGEKALLSHSNIFKQAVQNQKYDLLHALYNLNYLLKGQTIDASDLSDNLNATKIVVTNDEIHDDYIMFIYKDDKSQQLYYQMKMEPGEVVTGSLSALDSSHTELFLKLLDESPDVAFDPRDADANTQQAVAAARAIAKSHGHFLDTSYLSALYQKMLKNGLTITSQNAFVALPESNRSKQFLQDILPHLSIEDNVALLCQALNESRIMIVAILVDMVLNDFANLSKANQLKLVEAAIFSKLKDGAAIVAKLLATDLNGSIKAHIQAIFNDLNVLNDKCETLTVHTALALVKEHGIAIDFSFKNISTDLNGVVFGPALFDRLLVNEGKPEEFIEILVRMQNDKQAISDQIVSLMAQHHLADVVVFLKLLQQKSLQLPQQKIDSKDLVEIFSRENAKESGLYLMQQNLEIQNVSKILNYQDSPKFLEAAFTLLDPKDQLEILLTSLQIAHKTPQSFETIVSCYPSEVQTLLASTNLSDKLNIIGLRRLIQHKIPLNFAYRDSPEQLTFLEDFLSRSLLPLEYLVELLQAVNDLTPYRCLAKLAVASYFRYNSSYNINQNPKDPDLLKLHAILKQLPNQLLTFDTYNQSTKDVFVALLKNGAVITDLQYDHIAETDILPHLGVANKITLLRHILDNNNVKNLPHEISDLFPHGTDYTPLLIEAISVASAPAIKYLLDQGANIQALLPDGTTPLEFARSRNNPIILKVVEQAKQTDDFFGLSSPTTAKLGMFSSTQQTSSVNQYEKSSPTNSPSKKN